MFCFTFADVRTVKKVFKSLRDRFIKVRKEHKPSGSGGGVSEEPSWQFYRQLEFLTPFLRYKLTLGNLSDKTDSPVIANTVPEERASEPCETTRTAGRETIYAVYDDSQVMTAASAAVLPTVPAEVDVLVTDDGESTNNSSESGNNFFELLADSQQLFVTTNNSSESANNFRGANNFFQAGPIPKKKAKRVKEKEDNMKAILNALENSNEFIMSASKKQEPDADDLFGQSIGKELKELTDYQKSLAKLRIQHVLHESRWERGPQN